MLLRCCRVGYRFSIYNNQHQQIKEVINGKEVVYDTNVQRYQPTVQAYLQKRWTKKEEIAAKIYIIEPVASIRASLSQQTLFPLSRLADRTRLERMHEADEITPAYLMSVFCEEHFKPMIDEYLQKVLVNGQVPPLRDLSLYTTIVERVVGLYRVFFFGDPLSLLEQEIEFRYLVQKQRKFYRYQANQKVGDKCVWTYSQQRCLERMVNWRARELDLYDYQRPVYEPLLAAKKLDVIYQLMELDSEKYGIGLSDSIWRRLLFEFMGKGRYLKSRKQVDWIVSMLFTRTLLYTHSNQFLRSMHIPPDFHIEHSIVNMHVWLIINRLKRINTSESRYMAKIFDQQFARYTQKQISKIHLRKKNDFIKDVDQYMKVSRNYLNYHFNRNPRTASSHYLKLDALVWSIIYFEKIPRYSNRVYLMAEYLKVNFDYMSTLSYEQILDADIQFDVFKMSLDFKDRLLAINPPLSEEEFLEEFESDKPKKKYYYSYDESEIFKMPIEKPRFFERTVSQRRVDQLNKGLMYKYKKYYNLTTYDHFSTLEEQKQHLIASAKYVWNQEQEQPDMEDIRKVYHQRMKDV